MLSYSCEESNGSVLQQYCHSHGPLLLLSPGSGCYKISLVQCEFRCCFLTIRIAVHSILVPPSGREPGPNVNASSKNREGLFLPAIGLQSSVRGWTSADSGHVENSVGSPEITKKKWMECISNCLRMRAQSGGWFCIIVYRCYLLKDPFSWKIIDSQLLCNRYPVWPFQSRS